MNYRVVYKDELQHWGVKGMHWYERQYQYKDGSLTPLGRIHYGVGPPRGKAQVVYSNKRRVAGTESKGSKSSYDDKNENWDHASNKSTLGKSIATAIYTSTSSGASLGYFIGRYMGRPLQGAAIGAGAGAVAGLVAAGIMGVKQSNAKKNEERIAEANKESGVVDKATGFYKKADREYTQEEDIAAVNPGFKKYTDDTKNNCVLCTLTYDLRKKGYNVSANSASYGFYAEDVKRWYKDAKVVAKDIDLNDDDEIPLFPDSNKELKEKQKEVRDSVFKELSEQGEGARGYLSTQYYYTSKGRIVGFAGHATAYEVQSDGTVDIIDAQTGKVYKDAFNHIEDFSVLKHSLDMQYVRLDNIDVNPKTIQEVAHS